MPNLSSCSANAACAATWSPLVGWKGESKAGKQTQQLLLGQKQNQSQNSCRVLSHLCGVPCKPQKIQCKHIAKDWEYIFLWIYRVADSGETKISLLVWAWFFISKRKRQKGVRGFFVSGNVSQQCFWANPSQGRWFQVSPHGCQQQRRRFYRSFSSQPECYSALSALVSPTAVTLHHGGHDKATRYHFASGRMEDAFLNQWEGNSFKDTDLISSHCVSML